MGFTKIVRYGDTLEIYKYEKEHVKQRTKPHVSQLQKKRARERRQSKSYVRSSYSIARSRTAFFRFCHHNNTLATTVHFLTLTFADDYDYSECLRSLSRFWEKINKNYGSLENKAVSYIGVPELTKKGRYHFHFLVYNLPSNVSERERETRNIQRCWAKGYISIDIATYNSEGLAGYMAKYMAKHMGATGNGNRRSYLCSRNIEKITNVGSNSGASIEHIIREDFLPDELAKEVSEYKVPWLGTCVKLKYKLS